MTLKIFRPSGLLLLLLSVGLAWAGQAAAAPAAAGVRSVQEPALAEAVRRGIVSELQRLIRTHYVFPEKREQIASALERSYRAGRYRVGGIEAFSKAVNEDLAKASHDKHLSIEFNPQEFAEKTAQRERSDYSGIIARIRRDNHGYAEQKILPGNVRFVKVANFRWVPDESGRAVEDAVRFLRGGDAVILDLRGNSGGDPRAVQYLISHFFERDTELAGEFNGSTGEYMPLRTLSYLPAGRLTGKPLFVLMDGTTFSAGEEFAYEVLNYKLGELVGETTAGGANGSVRHPVAPGFIASIPYLRLVHPLTKTNWEGAGVPPHHKVSSAKALDHAMMLALTRLREKAPEAARREIDWALLATRAKHSPHRLTAHALAELVGTYGERQLFERNGELLYQRNDREPVRLLPLETDLFQMGEDESLRLRIVRSNGPVSAIELVTEEGVIASSPRS
jgi:hypothetical protein